MFMLIERQNMIESGSDVPIFPTKEIREVIEYRQRRHLIIVVRVGQNSFLVRAANSLNSAV
jgi:hypothetical protein